MDHPDAGKICVGCSRPGYRAPRSGSKGPKGLDDGLYSDLIWRFGGRNECGR